jgi:hypothetical protein
MTESLPATAVVRVSRWSFDPGLAAEADALTLKQADYLEPAIRRLPGLIHWYSGVSPDGALAQVSVWDSVEHAKQMDHLKEMVITARQEMEALVGPWAGTITNYPIGWTI